VNLIDPLGLEVYGTNFGGSHFRKIGAGSSTAVLFEANGKANRFGIVFTQEGGAGNGSGLYIHGVYGPYENTIESYAYDAFLSSSGSMGILSGSVTWGAKNPFYEIGISPPLPWDEKGGYSLTYTTGQVWFAFEYSFGAADTFYGDWFFNNRDKIKSFIDYLFDDFNPCY
jgi:hypothetical protein